MSGCLVRIVIGAAVLFSPLSVLLQGIILAGLFFEGAARMLLCIARKMETGKRPSDLHDALGFPVRRVD